MRILVVDDSEEVRLALRLMLDGRFEVDEAADGAAALQACRLRQADLVLCDLYMPGMDGLETIRDLRRDFPGIQIIAMSGGGFSGRVDMLATARHFGAVGVLKKPFSQATVLASIGQVLQGVGKA